MLTLKKVKEMVKAPAHTKRVPSPKVLLEEGRIFLRKEFEHGSHLTLYHNGYVWFSAGKRNTVFHIHDCRGDYAYGASKGKGEVIKEEYFENCEWHIRALFEGEQRVEESQLKCEGVGQTKVSVSYHAVAEDWGEMADSEINVLDKYIEKEALHAMMAVLTKKQRNLIDNSEKNREYRCRSYEYQVQHGFMITADNYGTGYSGTATRGMGAEAIRKKMESINPDKFKIRKFGVSDVIGLTAEGKTSFFYVDKDRLVRFNGFFPKPQSGTYLILDEGGYQVAGQKGTWLVSDEVEVDGQRFVQMRSEQTKNPPPSIILHESGAFVTQTALGFDGEATRKMSTFLQGPKPELLHHQKFFENGTAERAKESGTEQNYNMIDGCVNNVPKKPRRIGGRWSVLDRLHIKQAERRQKDNAPQQEQERSRKN